MIIFILLIIIFLSFYTSCYYKKRSNKTFYISVFLFVLSSIFLRFHIPFDESADYVYYSSERIFDLDFTKPFQDISVSIIFNSIDFFLRDRITSIKVFYILLFLQGTIFYLWLIKTKLELYKKIVLFSTTYFLFSFILLRNALGYELVFFFFYHLIYKQKKKYWLLFLAVTFHFSSMLVLFTTISFEMLKKYAFLFILIITLIVYGFIDINIFILKIKVYYNYEYNYSLNHLFWLLFIIILFAVALKESYEDVVKTRLYLVFILFTSIYFINPVPAFRFSIYFLGIFSCIQIKNSQILKNIKKINLYSLVFLFFFIFTFFKTHLKVGLLWSLIN